MKKSFSYKCEEIDRKGTLFGMGIIHGNPDFTDFRDFAVLKSVQNRFPRDMEMTSDAPPHLTQG